MPQEQGPYAVATVGQPITLPDPMQARGVTSGIQAVLWNLSAFTLNVQRPDGLSTIPAFTADIVPIKTIPGDLTVIPQLSPGGNASQPGQVLVDWYGPGEVLTGVFPVSLPAQALSSGVIAITDQQFLAFAGELAPGGQATLDLLTLPYPPGTTLANYLTAVLVVEGTTALSGWLSVTAGDLSPGFAWEIVGDTNSSFGMAAAPLVTGGDSGYPEYLTVANAGLDSMSYSVILCQAVVAPIVPSGIPTDVADSNLRPMTRALVSNTAFGSLTTNQVVVMSAQITAAISDITPGGASGLMIRLQSNNGLGTTIARLVLPATAGAHDHIVVTTPIVFGASNSPPFLLIAEWIAAAPTAVAGAYAALVGCRFSSG